MGQLKQKKLLALILTCVLVVTSSGLFANDDLNLQFNTTQSEVTYGQRLDVAKWEISAASTPTVAATGGENKSPTALLAREQNAKTLTYSSSGISSNGWDNGFSTTAPKYWQAVFSTKHFSQIKVSSSHRSSATGPRDFVLQYSLDGITFSDVPNSEYVIGSALSITKLLDAVSLPPQTDNQDQVFLRWAMRSNTSAGGVNAVASGGTSQINSIIVTGTEIITPLTPLVSLASGAYPLGTAVSITNNDPTSTLLYQVNEGEFQTYDPTQPVILSVMPATLKVKAVKEGETSRIVTMTYTQSKVDPVIASKATGNILPNTGITLTTQTSQAQITYVMTINEGLENEVVMPEAVYTGAIVITSDMFPVKIVASASKEGFVSSGFSTFKYTQKIPQVEKLYFGQLHAHTNFSDGVGTPEEAFAYAANVAKVDYLAITDHSNYLDKTTNLGKIDDPTLGEHVPGTTVTKWLAGLDAADKATHASFIGIYGYEMTWAGQYGHINTFNTAGFVSRNNATYNIPGGTGLKNYYDLLKTVPQSISQFNHPSTTFGDFDNFGYYSPEIDKQITLIEVGNGEGAVRSSGYFASYDYYQKALDKGWHVAPTNNQDNHKGKWGDANTARTVILTDDFSRTGIYAAMKAMKVYATEDQNLAIRYTINGEPFGTIFEDKMTILDFSISVQDPDLTDNLNKISIIADGGVIVKTQTFNSNIIDWNFSLEPNYSFYYVKVEQLDKDIAVTAPIWVGDVTKIGIGSTSTNAAMHVVDEAMTMTTTVFNNEKTALTVDKIDYVVDGQIIHTVLGAGSVLPLTTNTYTFDFTPQRQGKYDFKVIVYATLAGNAYTFNGAVNLDVISLGDVTTLAIDGAHSNFYVSGNYKDSDKNFIAIAGTKNVRVKRITTVISDETLAGVSALVLTTPERHTFGAYVAKNYTADELQAIKRFADNGGHIILTSTGERLSGYNSSTSTYGLLVPYEQRSATISNNILEAIGATTRFNDDEVVDLSVAPTSIYRLAFNRYNYDSNSPFLKNVKETTNQNYSFYSGNSLQMSEEALVSGKATSLIYGNPTSKGIKWAGMLTEQTLKPDHEITVPEGNVVALATETLPGGGFLLASGVTFFSTFEVKVDIDNSTTLQNSNYAIVVNLLEMIKPERPITPIATVQKANLYEKFKIRGVVTSNASGFDQDTAFFDSIYVKDETGGINLFPVSGHFKIGDTVEIVGLVGAYQGEKQLTVDTITKIDVPTVHVEPLMLTTQKAMDSNYLGQLIKVTGKVVDIAYANGLVSDIFVNDGTGTTRLFMDGYITKEVDLSHIKVGDTVSGIGLSSIDPLGSRLRVRNRAEIVKIQVDTTPPVITVGGVKQGVVYDGNLSPTFTVNEEALVIAQIKRGNSASKTFLSGERLTANGTYTLVITATDLAGNVSTKTLVFAIDKSNPNSNVTNNTPQTPTELVVISDLTTPLAAVDFTDMQGHWAKGAVANLISKGAVKGYADGSFKPNQNVTRSEFVTLIMRAFEKSTDKKVEFADVSNHWSKEEVGKAAALGLVTGYKDGSFKPLNKMTREEVAVVLYRLNPTLGTGKALTFTDQDKMSSWAKEAIQALTANGIITGYPDGSFNPKGLITRGEVAKMIDLMLQLK